MPRKNKDSKVVKAYDLLEEQLSLITSFQSALRSALESAGNSKDILELTKEARALSESTARLSSEARQWQRMDKENVNKMTLEEQIKAAAEFLLSQPVHIKREVTHLFLQDMGVNGDE